MSSLFGLMRRLSITFDDINLIHGNHVQEIMERLRVISQVFGLEISEDDVIALRSWGGIQKTMGRCLTDWDPERGLGFLGAWIHNQKTLLSTLDMSKGSKTFKFLRHLIHVQMRVWVLTKEKKAYPCFMSYIEELYRTWTLLQEREDTIDAITRYLELDEEILDEIQNPDSLQKWIDRKITFFNQTGQLPPVSILRSLFKSWFKGTSD